jgi:2-polyprenyl-3-methyl-5-hydroxy-6-metoxy-1,4-benzoquinol methylase
MMDKFEKLRDMEPFSEDMFNRIFEFQQKLHPAWNAALPFDQRIKNLPLHNLVFSNPDRDPAQFGPTITTYYPLRAEMQKIAAYARAVAPMPHVCDLHGGNGFIGSLLAREGVQVTGMRDPDAKPHQIAEMHDPTGYQIRSGKVSDIDFGFDVAFSSWMPAGVNLTPEIVRHTPKLIVYIHTDHVNAETGVAQTGTPEAYTDLPARYKLIDQWSVTRPADMFYEVWPDLSRCIEETRQVKIYADEPWHDLAPVTPHDTAVYDWEKELEIIQLALEAKSLLRARGHQV